MQLGRYRLLAQVGAGRDGVAYRAAADNGPVEVRVLAAARADAERWETLLKRLRMAALVDHPHVLHFEEVTANDNPPFVALEWVEERNVAAELAARVPLPVGEILALSRDWAGALAAAHRLGLAHGAFNSRCFSRGGKIDFSGLHTHADDDPAFAELDASCRAPENRGDAAADVFALGAILFWLLSGKPHSLTTPSRPALDSSLAGAPLDGLIESMLLLDPSDRPSARAVAARLDDLLTPATATGVFAPTEEGDVVSASVTVPSPPVLEVTEGERQGRVRLLERLQAAPAEPQPEQLGRYRLLEKLGEGGMGAVYRAEDLADGRTVAVKVLRPTYARKPGAVKRFHKEARILSEVHSPYVANLLEINEDQGVHFLVLEFVAGRSLGHHLLQHGKLEEKQALAIVADVARALADAHDRGIVHRDIKPENIILVSGGVVSGGDHSPFTTHDSLRVKLLDFGLARHVLESESLNLTQAGAVLGTPLYMAPEQATGNPVDPRADVYSLGATLYHLLAGRPPFQAEDALSVLAMHREATPPSFQQLRVGVSDGTSHLVARCLAKSPEGRYANAGELLNDLERLLRGEPTHLVLHPRLPDCNPKNILHYDFTWELAASPEQLWPHVSNTERLNRAIGLPAVAFTTQFESDRGVRRFGKFRKVGMALAWEEHPFEWVEGRRMGVLREYREGPLKWLASVVELAPRPGGTLLTHRVRVEPHGLLGRTVAAVEVGVRGRRGLDRVYRRIDAAVTGKLAGHAVTDPFEAPAALSAPRRRLLETRLDRLSECGIDPGVLERLGDFLAQAPMQEIARIRPLALARRLGLDAEQVVAACLHGARQGLFLLLWDIVCPICRIPSEVKDTLKALKEHAHCEACHLDFDLDFANSVEMIFRLHPEIRPSELGVYCIGGPAHSPHVAAQVRVRPGERMELELALPEGAYRLRGPQLPFTVDFRVSPSAFVSRWAVSLSHGLDAAVPRQLKAGRQILVLSNEHAQELLVRVERTAPRDDALTAARASTMALFRTLFPGEVLSPGQLVSVANVTLLVADLDGAGRLYHDLGDAQAFAVIHEFFHAVEEKARAEGGALLKTAGEAAWAAFPEPVSAVRAALALPELLRQGRHDLSLRVGIHRGPALTATLNGHLDYFGSTVALAGRLPGLAAAGETILTDPVTSEPPVAALLRQRGLEPELLKVDSAESLVYRLARAQTGRTKT